MSKLYSRKDRELWGEWARIFRYWATTLKWMAICLMVIAVADVVWSVVHGTSHPGGWIFLAFLSVIFSLFWWILDFTDRYLRGSD